MGPSLRHVGRLAALLAVIAAMAVAAGCTREARSSVTAAPPLDGPAMDARMHALARAVAPASIGAAVLSIEDGQSWAFNGERRFPLADTANVVIAAAALAEVEAGRLRPSEILKIREQDLSPPPSAVAEAWPARTNYSVNALLDLAVAGDSTAADVLMKRIGGPGAVGGWLQAQNLTDLRIDRYARERTPDMLGVASFRPAWKGNAAWAAVAATIRPERRRAALAAYLADPRDTATPQGMLAFLAALDRGELLGPGGSSRLRGLLDHKAAPGRMAISLPPGARLTGAASAPADAPVITEAGLAKLADGRRYAMAVFAAGPGPSPERRQRAVGEAAKAMAAGVR